MAQTSHSIAEGAGWRVSDVVCSDGPHDRGFEEQHKNICVAVVLEGTFHYRGRGEAMLAPGMLLTGNIGQSFECGHDHTTGDRCLSFNYQPEFAQRILNGVPGVRGLEFRSPNLPPSARLIPLVSAGLAASRTADCGALEEVAVRLLGYAAARQADVPPALRIAPNEQRIVAESLHLIQGGLSELDGEALSLSALSGHFGISPYRYLRLFHRIVGMTPHQFVLHLRLSRAAARLLAEDEDVSAIAFDEGFGDLSTFNHRFRALLGTTPTKFRVGAFP